MAANRVEKDFWTQVRVAQLCDLTVCIYKPSQRAKGVAGGVVPLKDVCAALGGDAPADTWGHVLRSLCQKNSAAADRMSHVLAAFRRLADSNAEVDAALQADGQKGVLVALTAAYAAEVGALPSLSSPSPRPVPRPAATPAGGRLDLFDAHLAEPDKWLLTWLFKGVPPGRPVCFTTYRLSVAAPKITRSVTMFIPPRSGETFVRFSNHLRVNASTKTPDPLRQVDGVVMAMGASVVLLGDIGGDSVKLMALERPAGHVSSPYFCGLVQTYNKRSLIAARIMMVRRLLPVADETTFLQTFPKLVSLEEARASFSEELAALEAAQQLVPGTLSADSLESYLSNDLDQVPVLRPHNDVSK